MINVSNEFKEKMNESRDFREYADITFPDGTVLHLDDSQFTVSNNSIVDGAASSGIPLGVAVEKQVQIEILNDQEQYADLDFFGAKIRLYLTFQLDDLDAFAGTQLLPNTKKMNNYVRNANVDLAYDEEGFAVAEFPAVDKLSWRSILTRPSIQFSTVRGQTVTFSLYVRSDDWEELNADASHGLCLCFELCTGTSAARTLYRSKTFYATPLSAGWRKITWTTNLTDDFFKYGTGTIDENTRLFMGVYNYSTYSMQAKKFKLEYGDSDTGYTIAPEEIRTERIEKGTYTVTSPETYGETVIITAYDDMYKADRDYETNLTFPQTAGAVLRDACSKVDIPLGSTSFLHDDFIIQNKPSGTFRSVIGSIAMIACGNARMDKSGYLRIIPYVFTFTGRNHHELSEFKSGVSIDTNDIVITGIKTVVKGETSEEDTVLLEGDDAYIITVENELIYGKEQTVLSWLGERLIGQKMRPFSGDLVANPLIEFMDLAKIQDRRGRWYETVITDVNFVFGGFTTVKNTAPSMIRSESRYYSDNSKTENTLRKLVEKEKTDRETAVGKLANKLAQSSGMYITIEPQEDGSRIYYMHNKPTLPESDIVWKLTAEAFGISTDGGKTYPYGFTITGEMITRLLYAEGINADYIDTGSIVVRDQNGNILFSADMDTGQVIIDGSSVKIGVKTATQAIKDAETQAKSYSDGKLADYANVVAKDISNLQNQIDGQIETFYYDYEPTMQNVPASQWTNESERKKHIGDLFYWKSKGYSYRFFQDGATWKWQLVQDTDITSAMAAAEKAQDTADGKRRVFVVTPQPPYDIGDLWTNGTDILTCVVAREQGSAYVSSDWKKLNKYTDNSFAEQVQQNLDSLQIGGTNLLHKTRDMSGYGISSNVTLSKDSEGFTVASFASVSTLAWNSVRVIPIQFSAMRGKTVTVSLEVRSADYVQLNAEQKQGLNISFNLCGASSVVRTKYKAITKYTEDLSEDWKKITVTATLSDEFFSEGTGTIDDTTRFFLQVYNYSVYRMEIRKIKLEVGTKATDWSPAPEDTESYADNLAADLQNQIDGKIQSYNQTSDPSTAWTTTAVKTQHTGDIWYNPTTKETKRWSGTAWGKLENKEAEEASALAQKKAQVFTVTPTTPYRVGDLWFNSSTSDIMTCVTARASGNYVSSDWAKRNKYTDDTKANEALEEAQKSRNLNMILDNEYQAISTDHEGNYTEFPEVKTKVQVLYGHADVSSECDYNVAKSQGVTGNFDTSSRTYTVTGLSTDSGWVDITATYITALRSTKRFNIAKIKGGKPGEIISLESSVSVIKQGEDGELNPSYIDFSVLYKGETNSSISEYAGRFKIEESTDGKTWRLIYKSKKDESSVRHSLYTLLVGTGTSTVLVDENGYGISAARKISHVRCSVYAAGGFNDLIDVQSIPTVLDADALTHEKIFNLLTNNGIVQGIFMLGGQLYINGQYIKALSIAAEQIATRAITTDKLDAKAVTAEKAYFDELAVVAAKIAGFILAANRIYHQTTFGSTTYVDTELNSSNRTLTFRNEFGNSIAYTQIGKDGIKVSNTSALNLKPNADSGEQFGDGTRHTMGATKFTDTVEIAGNLVVSGSFNKKSIIKETENYGRQAYYCYEIPAPMLGDVGSGVLDDEGTCIIPMDDIFTESTNTIAEYYVFLQREGQGDCWVSEKTPAYFEVRGTPGLRFVWEVKAKQMNLEHVRFTDQEDVARNVGFKEVDYEELLNGERQEIITQMEEVIL